MKLEKTAADLMNGNQVRNRKVKINPKKAVSGKKNPEKLAEVPSPQQEEQTTKFISGMLSRGLIPIENRGGGNCVFISLAQIVMGDSAKFDFMR